MSETLSLSGTSYNRTVVVRDEDSQRYFRRRMALEMCSNTELVYSVRIVRAKLTTDHKLESKQRECAIKNNILQCAPDHL